MHSRNCAYRCFDLAQFYPVALMFDLKIFSGDIYQFASVVVFDQVAGFIDHIPIMGI